MVSLDFEHDPGLFVLQLTYDESLVSDENLLEMLYYDPQAGGGAGAWVSAVLNNSDGGAGYSVFEGSYEQYLAATDGLLTPDDLSVFGRDVEANHIWCVLDHASIFGVGVPEPTTCVLLCVGVLTLLRRRRGAA